MRAMFSIYFNGDSRNIVYHLYDYQKSKLKSLFYEHSVDIT